MKKLLLIFILFTISILGYSQKCKYDFEQKDPFSGKTIVGIGEKISNNLVIQIATSGDSYSFSLGIRAPGVSENFFSVGDTLRIAIDNKDPLILVSNMSALPGAQVISSNIFTHWQISYSLTFEQAQILLENTVTALNPLFNKNTGGYLFSIPEKKWKKLSKRGKCILDYAK